MTLKWGIVGAGKISTDFVKAVAIIPKAEGHQVVAVASQNIERAKQFAENLSIPKAYGDYNSLANDAEIDVVYVGNLNNQHYPVAKLMLEHGKKVLCEKPLTMNEKQTRDLIELAEKKKLFFMEAIWSRCFPLYDRVRQILHDGLLGDVYFVSAHFGVPLAHKDRIASKELGGGTILDLGVYTLQFQQFIFGGAAPLKMVSNGHLNADGVDESASTIITYANGKTAALSTHGVVRLPNEAVVVGTKGTLRIPSFWCPDTLITDHETSLFKFPDSKGVEFNHHNSTGLSYEAQEVKRCIDAGLLESPKITHKETLQLAQLMDAWRKDVEVVFPEDN